MSEKWKTRQTLLRRAKDPNDDKAWEEFVSYYRDFIRITLIRMEINSSYHDDILQLILLRIWNKLPTFEIDPERAKFRTWLSYLIRNIIINYMIKEQRRSNRHNKYADEPEHMWERINESEFESLIEQEWKQYLSNLAMDNVKKSYSGNAIEVFNLSLQGMPVSDIAKQLDIAESSVYTLKLRVRDSLIQEISRLRNELEL